MNPDAIAFALAASRPSGFTHSLIGSREDFRVWDHTRTALKVGLLNRGLLPTDQARRDWHNATMANVR